MHGGDNGSVTGRTLVAYFRMMRFIFVSVAMVCCVALSRADDRSAPVPLSIALSAPMPSAEFPFAPARDSLPPQKSKAWAGFFSAVLPGMGELYAGRYETGKFFTAGELLLWLGYAGMT